MNDSMSTNVNSTVEGMDIDQITVNISLENTMENCEVKKFVWAFGLIGGTCLGGIVGNMISILVLSKMKVRDNLL